VIGTVSAGATPLGSTPVPGVVDRGLADGLADADADELGDAEVPDADREGLGEGAVEEGAGEVTGLADGDPVEHAVATSAAAASTATRTRVPLSTIALPPRANPEGRSDGARWGA
jgi:hypothetical protein